MSNSNGIISAPVTIDDVKTVLGESSNDLATLCKSSNINMWAKYKPTIYPSDFPSDWYKAGDGNYGLNITVENGKSNWRDLVAEYSKINNGYTNLYARPTGGSTAPYRLGDFRGYFHNANPEVKNYLMQNVFIKENDTNQLMVSYNPISGDGKEISYFDFAAYRNKYFGYIITDTNKANLEYIVTAGSTKTFVVPLPSNALQVGNYLAFPMFCSYNYSSNHTLHAMTCYAIPNLAGGKHLSIISQSESVASNFKQITATKRVNIIIVTLTMKDNANTVKNVAVYCVYKTDPSKGEHMVTGEYMSTVGTMNAGEIKTVSFSNLKSEESYRIYVIANYTWIVKGLYPFISNLNPNIKP